MLENRLVLQCFTGHLLLLGSPWTQFCSASVEEQWEAGQGRTLTFFELRTSYAIMCHFLVSEIANRFGLFFLSRNQSPKSCIAAWTEHTHAAICMWLKQNKQMYTNVIICQLTTSIYVNLLQQWIWICWISVYHRIDYQKGIWHIKHHQNICSIQQLFFRGLRLKFHIVSRKNHVSIFGILWISIEVSTAKCKHFTLHLLFICLQPWNGAGIGGSWFGCIENHAPSELPVHLTLWETLICTLQPG